MPPSDSKPQTVADRKPIVLAPGAGRAYPMGRIAAVFKADEAETASRYSVSEWWLEPRTQGPGPFEPAMPEIAAWFAEHPPQDTAA